MRKQFTQYKYIYLISVIGFFITGILKYPYPLDWDSQYVIDTHILGNMSPASWMGWFYPCFWKILYKMTNNINSMGIFINIIYWISLPIIYINLLKNKHNTTKENCKNNSWYLIFILYPFAVKLVTGVTNNILVTSLLLLSIASYSLYNTYKNKIYIVIALILLVIISLVRRDAFIFITPLVIFFSVILANYNKIVTGLILGLLLLTYMGANYLAIKDNPNYYERQTTQLTIDNVGVITAYDLTIMSYFKNELLLPDFILKEEFRNENRIQVLEKIKSIYDMAEIDKGHVFDGTISPLLLSETVWYSGLSAKDVIPIYIKNIPLYIELKSKIFLKYLTVLWLTLSLSLVGIFLLFIKPCSSLFSQEKKAFCLTVVGASWISIGVTVLAANTVQYRYIIPPSMLMWIISMYILYTITTTYKFNISYEERERSNNK